jgi:hypothetical protein
LQSIYFHDPNGLRLEFAWRSLGPEYLAACAGEAHGALDAWTADKRAGRLEFAAAAPGAAAVPA